MLIIRADILLRVCRGNGEAALQGAVVHQHTLARLCVCRLVYDCLRAEESLLPGNRRAEREGD